MLPEFDHRGALPPGIHVCSPDEFKNRFLSNQVRRDAEGVVHDLFDYALSNGAISVLVGGSFVTTTDRPQDIDCVVLFASRDQIPRRVESLYAGRLGIDIFFASIDQPDLVNSFIKLFTTSRFGDHIGAVQVIVREGSQELWRVAAEPDENNFEVIRRIYSQRHFIERAHPKKILVTVHGIRTYADWNAEITMNASANGWTVAPFQYGFVDFDVFFNTRKSQRILDDFREFLVDVKSRYPGHISIIAHSFGTYLVWKYLTGFENEPPVSVDTLILAGSVLNENLDLEKVRDRVGYIIHEVAPNDFWAPWGKRLSLYRNPDLGKAGLQGFTKKPDFLSESRNEVFTHNNVIKRDVVVQRWLPHLEAHRKRTASLRFTI